MFPETGAGSLATTLAATAMFTAVPAVALARGGHEPGPLRPLPFEEWARGAAAVNIQSLVVP
jgi:hypothetical protein